METNDCMAEFNLTPQERKRLRIIRACTALLFIIIGSIAIGALLCKFSTEELKRDDAGQTTFHESRDSIVINSELY